MNESIRILHLLMVVTIGLLLSTSCVEKMTHLSKKDKEWVNAYHEGDTVIYKSNKGNIDTMIVDEVVINDNWNPIANVGPGGNVSIGAAHIRASVFHQGDTINYHLWIARTDYFGPIKYQIDFDSRMSKDAFEEYYPDIVLNDENLTIDDRNSEILNYRKREYGSNIKRARLDKEKGLLYYEFEDGERFTFYKRIHKSNQK
ncbi:MAG: hypothetical protein ACI391_00350 [Muribaculaceae bacterium]